MSFCKNPSETPAELKVDAKPTPTLGKKFPCRACGASLVFDPAAQTLKCQYCGHQEKIPQSANDVVENSYEAYLQQSRAGLKVTAGADLETRCQACGAVIMMDAKTVTQECPFCGVHLESQPKTAEPIIAPSAVLPFKIAPGAARKAFKQWVNSRWFAPNTFKQLADLGKLIGLYTPYWTFDAMTFTFYTGHRGTYYYVIESLIRQDLGGDEQRIESLSTQYSGITFKHILLPVWVSAYRYGDKLHRILINARTGEVQGDRPYSAWKIAGLVILILAIIGLIALLQSGAPQ